MNYTQKQVADILGTNARTISRFERGLCEPSLLEIYAFSQMCGVGIGLLIDDERNLAKRKRIIRL